MYIIYKDARHAGSESSQRLSDMRLYILFIHCIFCIFLKSKARAFHTLSDRLRVSRSSIPVGRVSPLTQTLPCGEEINRIKNNNNR